MGNPHDGSLEPAHKYTVPTINLSRYDELVRADGVYITWLRVGGECFEAQT